MYDIGIYITYTHIHVYTFYTSEFTASKSVGVAQTQLYISSHIYRVMYINLHKGMI